MNVYALTAGEYSDYRVLAMFSTREAAEAVLARHPQHRGYDIRIEEYPLDPGTLKAREGYFRFCVELALESGNVRGAPCEVVPDADDVGTVVEPRRYDSDRMGSYTEHPGHADLKRSISVTCWARDIDHAIKIASEKRREMLAQQSEPGETP